MENSDMLLILERRSRKNLQRVQTPSNLHDVNCEELITANKTRTKNLVDENANEIYNLLFFNWFSINLICPISYILLLITMSKENDYEIQTKATVVQTINFTFNFNPLKLFQLIMQLYNYKWRIKSKSKFAVQEPGSDKTTGWKSQTEGHLQGSIGEWDRGVLLLSQFLVDATVNFPYLQLMLL